MFDSPRVWHHGDATIIDITGDLDLATAPALRQLVVELLGAGHRRFVVDLSAAGFVDSIGLGVFVAVRKRARMHDGEVEIVCPQARIARLFQMVDLDRVFRLHATLDAALGALGSAGDATGQSG